MSLAVALLYFLLALGCLGWFAHGLVMVFAAARLEGRVARVAQSTAGASAWQLPNWLAARGRDREEIVEKLQQAGFQGNDAIERFLWLRLAATAAAAVLGMAFAHWMWGSVFAKPLMLPMAPALTYLASKRALKFAATARIRAITAEFPFLLDLMLMMLEAGISLDQCFRSIARDEARAVPQLNRSLRGLVEDLDRGMSYEAALDRWTQRIAVPGIKDLASLFQQGLFQGIELAPTLRHFVREFTDRRIATAREAMGRIAVQLVVVMMLCFMPAIFIVVGGPPVAGLMDTFKGMNK
jgi:tight adherence protein C